MHHRISNQPEDFPKEPSVDEQVSSEKAISAAEDIALMLRAKNDDLEAFSDLVKKHQKSVMNFYASCGVYSDVEDLAQNVFLKLYRVRRSYKPTAKFTTFLFLIARQMMIDSIRHRDRKSKLHENYGKEIDDVVPVSPMFGEREDAEVALSCLSQGLREAVSLVIMQGMAYAEAAEIMGIPVGTVKSRVSIALGKMREFMNRQNF